MEKNLKIIGVTLGVFGMIVSGWSIYEFYKIDKQTKEINNFKEDLMRRTREELAKHEAWKSEVFKARKDECVDDM